MAYKDGVVGGCISLLIGVFMFWLAFDYGSNGLQVIIYAFGGFLILFGLFGIIVSLRS
jgi:hypothetical protein